MKIGIIGGTGLVGMEFIPYAIKRGHTFRIFTRKKDLPYDLKQLGDIDFVTTTLPTSAQLEGMDAIINLVGEPIAGVRWTDERKTLIRTSRVEFTKGLVARIKDCKRPPSVYIQASAIGYYGMSESEHEPYDENTKPGDDFLASVCVDWENQTIPLRDIGIRTIVIRTGIVLSPKGGALEKMIPPFKMGVGGPIASGKQGMSWVHIADLVSAMLFLLGKQSSSGSYNVVSPFPCSNARFSEELAKVLFRPALMRVPAFAVQMLYGDGALVITRGQYVYPKRLLEEGYEFQYQYLRDSLTNLIKKN
ncbi:TIGR01777 family oxidoreductase [Leptospira sp. 'Mane']|uniref:TIGR01777 family oxidoreductase n=1 Tax=Leptospira sp. 'Mane' TaxID=3387407 RepID=UPI00398B09FD